MPFSKTPSALINNNWGTASRAHRGAFSFANAPYAGVGDVQGSGWLFWCGLRAFSFSTIGNNAVTLRRDSDNTTATFTTVAGGGLDLTGISSFKGAANLFATKLFDQSGGGIDLTQGTNAKQPPFLLSQISGNPAIVNSGSTYLSGTTAGFINPFTYVIVAKNTSGGGRSQLSADNGGTNQTMFNLAVANKFTLYDAGGVDVSQTDGNYHAIVAVHNGASSAINVDGTDTGVSSGTNNFQGATFLVLSDNGVADFLIGNLNEFGMISGTINATVRGNLTSNQRTFWGF